MASAAETGGHDGGTAGDRGQPRTRKRKEPVEAADPAAGGSPVTLGDLCHRAEDNLPNESVIIGTLRWAVAQAELGEFDAIEFALPAGQDSITLFDSSLLLTNAGASETIDGPSTALTINGGGSGPVFQLDPGHGATISGLTIDGGDACTLGAGGGVVNLGKSLTLDDCTIGGNSAVYGGGIFNSGTVTVNDCTISGNTAAHRGGVSTTSLAARRS